jgi:hypothetical protein
MKLGLIESHENSHLTRVILEKFSISRKHMRRDWDPTLVVLVFLFWRETVLMLHTYLSTIQLCSCVGFLVVAGNSSQNENTFWFSMSGSAKKSYWVGLLYYDPLADVCILCALTLFYSVSLYSVSSSCILQIHKLKFKSEYYTGINSWNHVKTLLLCISFLHYMDLEPYNHNHFSKISITSCASRN